MASHARNQQINETVAPAASHALESLRESRLTLYLSSTSLTTLTRLSRQLTPRIWFETLISLSKYLELWVHEPPFFFFLESATNLKTQAQTGRDLTFTTSNMEDQSVLKPGGKLLPTRQVANRVARGSSPHATGRHHSMRCGSNFIPFFWSLLRRRLGGRLGSPVSKFMWSRLRHLVFLVGKQMLFTNFFLLR
jgi:hypothetical protein